MTFNDDLLGRACQYAQENGLLLGDQLGFGVHGIVFATKSQYEKGPSAIKVYHREADYCREHDVYFRLKQHGVSAIRGCRVPQLLQHDERLWVIEMTLVSRPFVLDFAGAYLDQAPDFSEEVLADWHAEKREHFGARWAEAQAVLRALEGYGVFMIDVNTGNISFAD